VITSYARVRSLRLGSFIVPKVTVASYGRPMYRAGHYIFALFFFFRLLSSSLFFPRRTSAAEDWMSTILLHMVWPSANLECRSETWCTQLAENAGPKKSQLGTISELCRAISSQLRHVLTSEKNFLSSNISLTCPYNIANFGPLAAEIVSLVWGTPANFNGFRVLTALLHGTPV